MRVFISWSGTTSRMLAESLRDWIPYVLPSAQPWMSATDIDRGARWSVEVATHLDSANVGIICLTSENLEAPWILFEAGALSKILSKSLVCTYLFQLRPADVKGPLAQFQATVADQLETKRLLVSMNRVLGADALSDARLDRMFEKWWPELESSLSSISKRKTGKAKPDRSDRELIEEILGLQRRNDPRAIASEVTRSVLSLFSGSDVSRLVPNDPDHGKGTEDRSQLNTSLTVNTKPLVGAGGRTVRIPYPVFGTVSDFLDVLYGYVENVVPAETYGHLWVLRDPKTGNIFKEMGRSWAKATLKRKLDDRQLQDVGITPGMNFEVVRIRED